MPPPFPDSCLDRSAERCPGQIDRNCTGSINGGADFLCDRQGGAARRGQSAMTQSGARRHALIEQLIRGAGRRRKSITTARGKVGNTAWHCREREVAAPRVITANSRSHRNGFVRRWLPALWDVDPNWRQRACSSVGNLSSLIRPSVTQAVLLCGLTAVGCLTWLLGHSPVAMPPWFVIWLLAGAPLVEEVIFRLGLHQELLTSLRSAPAANVLTALAFAMAHVLAQGTRRSLLTLLPALVIGAVYQRSRRVAPCVAVHATFNSLWLIAPSLTAGS